MISAALAVLETDEQRNELTFFYEKNKNSFFAVASSKLHSKHDIEDAVQEAFLRVANKPDKFFLLEDSKKIAYLNVIVRNVAIDIYNKNVKNFWEYDLDETSDDCIDNASLLENDVLGRISSDELMVFIKTLPLVQRDILTLHCLFGLTMEETAEKLNISLPMAKKKLYLARKSIKQYINERGNI